MQSLLIQQPNNQRTLGPVENKKFVSFNPGHVDSDVTHKNNEENAEKSSFRLKTYCYFDIFVFKGVDSKIQRENGTFSFFEFLMQKSYQNCFLNHYINLSDRYSSFDTHITIFYDILCHMTYVIKCQN